MISSQDHGKVYCSSFSSWQESVPRLLDAAGLIKRLASAKKIIIKPNLVEPQKPPVTTPVELIAVLADHIHSARPDLEIEASLPQRHYETKQQPLTAPEYNRNAVQT